MNPLYIWMVVLSGAAMAAGADTPPAYKIETIAGSSFSGDGGPATAAQVGQIQGIATDRLGNIYLSDTDNHRVRKVSTSGVITTIAGTGTAGFSGDGGQATAAQLNLPYGLACDFAGNLFIADLGNSRVRRIAPDGAITTLAGGGPQNSAVEGSLATTAQLLTPRNVAVDAAGNVYLSEFTGHRVRKITPDGRIWTVAGTGIAGYWGDGGQASNAQLAFPAGLAVDRSGSLYIADSQNQRIRRVISGNILVTALGGSPSTALFTPLAVTIDNAYTVYVADSTNVVFSYSSDGKWTNVTGTGEAGFSGDGGLAAAAQVTAVHDLAVDLFGFLYLADSVRVRAVDHTVIHTVAGDGYLHAIGDGGPALSALLSQPVATALDYSGNLFIADSGTNRIRQITPSGLISTVAGTGLAGFKGDSGPAAAAQLYAPGGMAFDMAGNLVFADTFNQRIRKVSRGVISSVIGTGTAGSGPENTQPLNTPLRSPAAVCFDLGGNQFVVDTLNNRVLLAPPAALVTTEAGNGAPGGQGDGGSARAAQLNQPGACAVDAYGSLYLADTQNNRVRKVTASGIITNVAGTGVSGFGGDGGPATAALLTGPRGVAVDGSGDVFIADSGNNRIRMVTPDGTIRTIAGDGNAGFVGDGAAALSAQLRFPAGLSLDGSGNIYIADSGNNRIRRLAPLPPQPAVAPPEPAPPAPLVVQNAASQATGAVAPGELVIITGTGLGPESGVAGTFNSAGLVSNLLAGTEVRFDGVPAPIFYAQYGQVTVQVPYTVAGSAFTHVVVLVQGTEVSKADLQVADSAPGLFPTVINQDGSINSPDRPAPAGSTISLSATGEGLTTGANIAGSPAVAPYANPQLPLLLTVGGGIASVSYAGSAPNLVGVLQVNAAIPADSTAGSTPAVLKIGGASSQALTVWIGPPAPAF